MAQNQYGPGVRMGNWNEDVCLEEERMKEFLKKRERGELLIQRNRKLKKHLVRPEEEAAVFQKGHLSLCMSPDEVKSQLHDELEIPCGVSAVQSMVPTGRNTFIILSENRSDEEEGEVLRYGQNFRLGIVAGLESKMLYLTSEHRTLLKSAKKSWLQEVTLTDEVSHMNCWQVVFFDPQLRMEYEGFPVMANEKVVIYHCHTNRALVVHRHLFLRTYFGKEVEVAAHTYLDSHRVEKPKNHWMLVTGNPRDRSTTMLDLKKPPSEDTLAIEKALGIYT
ncbi:cilia- and flagella-associated protein 161 isoform X2 [Psammomys obesus]|uniref:cilia- and flagella-associated protein 161 isoform X2 n=1 Tax=Psammomys obesus TaxID=48139 RepID=UPI00245323BA|nr:cilia- and flagella-associated protein 161 isoform X2 [Psammomys obesus]